MSARDDFGSNMGRPGGGGAGGLGNGGIGGGMGGGGPGGGFGGGMTQNTGMRTGNSWNGTSMFGRPGGPALGYGMTPGAAQAASMPSTMPSLQQAVNHPIVQGIISRVLNRPTYPVGMAPPPAENPWTYAAQQAWTEHLHNIFNGPSKQYYDRVPEYNSNINGFGGR